jgi:hypothetical protein
MRNQKKVISHDSDRWLRCCWDDCDNDGYDLYKSRLHDHSRGISCDDILSKHPIYVFCSERHKQYFLYSHVKQGYLPAGMKNVL